MLIKLILVLKENAIWVANVYADDDVEIILCISCIPKCTRCIHKCMYERTSYRYNIIRIRYKHVFVYIVCYVQ